MRIEEERQDVLQNIEFAVARLYRLNPAMTDYAVLRTYESLVPCLKRLVKSVNKWTKHGGRQGYLNFMTQFVK